MEHLVAIRLPLVAGAFLLLVTLVGALDGWHMPQRLGAFLFLWSFHVILWAGMLAAVRSDPAWTFPSFVLVANLLSLSYCAYSARMAGSAELCLLVLVLFLSGFASLGCWGLRGQALSSMGALAGYPAALAGGLVPALPPSYSVTILCGAIAFTSLAAYFLDELREETHRSVPDPAGVNEAGAELLAAVSRELRAPLGAVVGYGKLYLKGTFGPATQRQSDAVRRMQQQSEQALDLLQGMMDFSTGATGSVPLDPEEFRLGDMLEHVAECIPPAWRKPGVQIDWNVKGAQTMLCSDRRKLEMIIRTLIRSVLDMTDEGCITVVSKPQFDTGQVLFTVSDPGTGIDSPELEEMQRVLHDPDTDGGRGRVGCGLPIVKRFTDALGGNVGLESRAGEGARFTLTIPLRLPG